MSDFQGLMIEPEVNESSGGLPPTHTLLYQPFPSPSAHSLLHQISYACPRDRQCTGDSFGVANVGER
ncbi:hypothetical protein EVAR_40565_1 [Eumeta japonica]|uniref:Uncharacterized protein n=1 Tax=Eumeta variegata TaxID=151549 RepID=A0A4C1VZ77_EUMVA|nr:hypothetical protein EVAR_40565_1 [Eumeta japonica]